MTNQQLDYYNQWKATGKDEPLTNLLGTLTSTVDAALRSYAGNNQRYRTRALILAREALDSYDPRQKVALNTYVMNNLKRLYRVSNERKQAIHVPENVRLDSLKVQDFVNRYKDENDGIEPSNALVAQNLKMNVKRVQKSLNYGKELPESVLTSEKGDEMSGITSRTDQDLWSDYVYFDLDEPNKKIFEWTTGYGGKPVLPKIEVAKRLKISPAAVSQRINTIQKKLSELDDLPTTGPSLV